jgi:hypothetical protein
MSRTLLAVLALLVVGCSHSSSGGNDDDGNEAGYPACPSGLEAGAPCELGGPLCFECANGDGFDCACSSDSGLEGPDAAIWFCVGTGYTCQ